MLPASTRRRPLRQRALIAAAVLATTAGSLIPLTAQARQAQQSHAAAHKGIAHSRCVLQRRKGSSGRVRTVRVCPKKTVKGVQGSGSAPSGTVGITVTQINPSTGAPVAEAPAAAPTVTSPGEAPPRKAGGKGAEPPVEAPAESTETPAQLSGTVSDPIDPRFLTEVPFGSNSFWVQPWRAYLDTWPASRLLESLGINFEVHAGAEEGVAQLLQDSGFKLARVGINWQSLSYSEPTRFVTETNIRNRLTALKLHGLRPLILLDANSQGPAPAKQTVLSTVAEAAAGATTVTLTPASAAAVVPGKTGFDNLSFGGSPDILITAVGPDDVAKLSRPLAAVLPAGAHPGSTLLYAPFGPPLLANGQPNPGFAETMRGWIAYVAAVCKEADSVVGPGNYDLEVWNELTFGSQFLNSEHYYSPTGEGIAHLVTKEVTKALLAETVAYVRNPANGISANVGITDGFASQTPFPSGASAPLGMTALSKHLYAGAKSFPAADAEESSIRPINALGQPDATRAEHFKPHFVPTYQSLFPEFYLSDFQTATIVRDLAPFTTTIYEFPHGREVGPEGGAPVQKWMTEYNVDPGRGTIMGPDGVTPLPGAQLTAGDHAHFQAKALLRSLVSMVSKGMTREYFFKAGPGHLSLINEGFFSAMETHPGTYPGDAAGGETMSGFRNMLAHFTGPGPTGTPRQLKLISIAQEGNHAQFKGDGTAAHPNLYDREVLAVFPFQSSPTRFVIPVYVMTRDLLTLYDPAATATDITRFDLPQENFRITLANLPETTRPPTVSAYDPLRNANTPAHILTREGNTATFEIAATDYPRLLTIDYHGS
jgi:hypothetical protein